MSKIVPVKNATLKNLSGYISHIGKYVPGAITTDNLPIKVTIQDPETSETFETNLVSLIPFTNHVPNTLALLSESLPQDKCTDQLLQRANVVSVSQLAFYLYESIKH